MLPFLLGLKLQYSNPLLKKYGISPYFRLETGLSYLTMSAEDGDMTESDSSIAGNFSTALGILYHNRALPYVDFLLDVAYLLAFEKQNGQYIFVSLGALYPLNWKM